MVTESSSYQTTIREENIKSQFHGTKKISKQNQTKMLFSIHKCNIRETRDLAPVKGVVKTFFGRLLGPYSTVVFMKSFIDDFIDSSDWVSRSVVLR